VKKFRFLILLLAYAALWFVCRSTLEYTVTVEPNGGTLLSGELVQIVKIGKDAAAPVLDNGRLELRWNGSFENIRQDTQIHAEWVKVPLEKNQLREYLRPRTVTVHAALPDGEERLAAGYFANENGRVVTAFGPLAGAVEITVETAEGRLCPVETVQSWDRLLDLAVLETGLDNTPWLERSAEEGEGPLYSWDGPLKNLRAGKRLAVPASIGTMTCVESDLAAVLPGGPLVDVYGDVVAVHHSLSEQKSLSVDVAMLDQLSPDNPKTPEELRSWYETEKSRSYEVWDGEKYVPSFIRTYQLVVGAECSHSRLGGAWYEGYYLRFDAYRYEYFEPEFGIYLDYLLRSGYELQGEESEGDITVYRYISARDHLEVILSVDENAGELEICLNKIPE